VSIAAIRSALLVVLGLLALSGCRHRGPPTLQTADERGIARLQRVAARELDCPDIAVTYLADAAYEASGCGRSAEYVHLCQGRRCQWNGFASAISRAEVALGCFREQITMAAAASTSIRQFAGCGRAVELELICTTGCTWTVRTPSTPADAIVLPAPIDEELVLPSAATAGGESDALALPVTATSTGGDPR